MAEPSPAPPDRGAVAPRQRRRGRWLRWTLIGLAVLLAVPIAGIAVLWFTLDEADLKRRVAGAVEAATGREVTLAGPIGIKASLIPTITLRDIALANIPGGSRPQMATVEQVEVRLALLPLLSREIQVRRLVLLRPDLLVERTADGRVNWSFAPQRQEALPQAPAAPEAARETSNRIGIRVDDVRVEGGQVTWRDAAAGATRSLAIPILTAQGAAAGGPVAISGELTADGFPLALSGETGSLSRVLDPTPGQPWPVRLVATSEGLRVTAHGSIANPARAEGWRVAVEGAVAELARLAPLVPDVPLPPLKDVAFAFTAAEADGALPDVSAVSLRVGQSDLSVLRPGLMLVQLEATAATLNEPLRLAGEARLNDVPLRLAGTLGAPLALRPGASQPYPVDLALQAGETSATAKGGIANPAEMTGVDLAVALRVPQLAALTPLVGANLPKVSDITAEARLAERGKGFAGGAHLRELNVASSVGAARGDLTFVIGARPALSGQLAASRIDLNALTAAAPAPGAQAAPLAPQPSARRERVIPDVALPLPALGLFDADLRLAVDELRAGEVAYRDIAATVKVKAGKARIEPLAVTLPGGRVVLSLVADATANPPAVRLTGRTEGQGVDLAPTLAAFGAQPLASGRLEAETDLSGRGRTTRELAGTLDGRLGLAMVNGRLDRRLLAKIPAEVLRVLAPQGIPQEGVALRCFALRAIAEDGVARSEALLVETGIGRVGGRGNVNLKTEGIDLRLVPDLQAGTVRVRAPVAVAGTLAEPRVAMVDPAGVAAAGLGAFLSLQNTPDRTLQELAGALGGGATPQLPDCASQLAIARGGRAGPVPAPAPAAAVAPAAPQRAQEAQPSQRQPAAPGLPQELQGPARDLLRGLFGGR